MKRAHLIQHVTVGILAAMVTASCAPTNVDGISLGPTSYRECVIDFFKDGPADQARFGRIAGLTVSSSGSLVVGDPYNSRIRSLSPDGQVATVIRIEQQGPGQFQDVAAGVNGTIYFLLGDFLYKVEGDATKVAGSEKPFIDFEGFWQPGGLTVHPSGDIIVADSKKNRVKKVTPSGMVTELAGSGGFDFAPINAGGGFADGIASAAMFYRPISVASDANGNLYVSDALNFRIRKIAPDLLVSTLAGNGRQGHVDGAGSIAQFQALGDIAASQDGSVYVVDQGNNAVRKINSNGDVSTLPAFQNGASPTSVAVDASGSVYISVFMNEGETRGGQIVKLLPDASYEFVAGELAACDWQTKLAY